MLNIFSQSTIFSMHLIGREVLLHARFLQFILIVVDKDDDNEDHEDVFCRLRLLMVN